MFMCLSLDSKVKSYLKSNLMQDTPLTNEKKWLTRYKVKTTDNYHIYECSQLVRKLGKVGNFFKAYSMSGKRS